MFCSLSKQLADANSHAGSCLQELQAENHFLYQALISSHHTIEERTRLLADLEARAATAIADAKAHASEADSQATKTAEAAWAYAAYAIAEAQAFYLQQVTSLKARASALVCNINTIAHQAIHNVEAKS